MQNKCPILISFSGMDGAGKTTQITKLQSFCGQLGLTTTVLTFWDHVVVFSRCRERFVQEVFNSEPGIGKPGKPVNRRDKNVRGWHMNLLRHGLYGLDAVNLRQVVARALELGTDVVILDRYIYDELANLSVERSLSRSFIRVFAKLVPQPDIAFVLDAEPEAARERKPEYPLDFLYEVRESYLSLANLLGTLTVVPSLSLSETERVVELAFSRILAKRRTSASDRLGVVV